MSCYSLYYPDDDPPELSGSSEVVKSAPLIMDDQPVEPDEGEYFSEDEEKIIDYNFRYPTIVKAVIKQTGYSFEEFKERYMDFRDASSEVSGFIYYSETHEFAIENRTVIIEMLDDMADNLGEDVTEMVANFGVFGNSYMDKGDRKDLRCFLEEGTPAQGTITNVMAWFALEEVTGYMEIYVEEQE